MTPASAQATAWPKPKRRVRLQLFNYQPCFIQTQRGKCNSLDTLRFELLGSKDTLVSGGDLDQDSVLVNTLLLVKSNNLVGLVDSGLGVERELGVNLGGNSTGDDLQDLSTELDEESVHGVLGLDLNVTNRWQNVRC